MFADFFRLAIQSVFHRKLRSFLTLLGIIIGIALIVSLISMSQGMKFVIEERFASLGADKIIVREKGNLGPPGTGLSINQLTRDDYEEIEGIPGVKEVACRRISSQIVEYNDEIFSTFLVSYPDDRSKQEFVDELNDYNIIDGKMIKKGERGVIVVSETITDTFEDLKLRDKINIGDKSFEVIGFLEKKGLPATDMAMTIPDDDMDIYYDKDECEFIQVGVSDVNDIDDVADKITKELKKQHGLKRSDKPDFTVSTSQDLLSSFQDILLIIQIVIIGIATISLLVGGIGIMNTMYTSVLERTKQIGVMKAIGAKKIHIIIIFLIEAALIGFIGGLIGIASGYGMSKLMEFFIQFQFNTPFAKSVVGIELIIISLSIATILGTLSGILPAIRAANLNPTQALRG